MGAQVLWQLARRGVAATGFETYAPGHPRGAAGGETRLFRNFELDDIRYGPVVRRADAIWRELQDETQRPLRTLDGALLMGSPSHEQFRTALHSAETSGLPYAVYDAAEMSRRHPQFGMDDGDLAIWDPGGGSIRPELTVAAAASAAERRGAVVLRDTRAEAVESRADGVIVRAGGQEHRFDRVVVAAGGWSGQLVPSLAPHLIVRRLTSVWYFGREPGYSEGVVPFIRTIPTYMYGLPVPDRTAVKVGLGFEHHLRVTDPDRVERVVRPDELGPFTEMVRRYLPGLDPHPMRMETYLETYTETRREWVGPAPDQPNVIVLAGFSGHGFKMCPAMGELGAQLALDEETTVDIGFLREGREAVA
jgi:sarcosine oxidase